ncbi:MAG: ATP-binding protein [Streptosporangiaceae bacterium]|jgi:serine/threonine-protein kinase RsbW
MSAAYPVLRPALGRERAARVFPGTPVSIERARAFVAAELAGCPAQDTLVTCVSELCTNAIRHTRSGAGGVFTVEVIRPREGVACVAVTDGGGDGEPRVRPVERRFDGLLKYPSDVSDLAEGGRGLSLVAALTSRWGHFPAGQAGGGRTVWAEATWPIGVPSSHR